MGRRSLKTTKAGKFMNPTDQFSKRQEVWVTCIFHDNLSFPQERSREGKS